MTTERLIKKYPNRRLYDTEESRYITQSEVKDLVMQSVPFRVVDSHAEADITRATLMQILLEQESGDTPLFSTHLLERFIRIHGDATQGVFAGLLEQSLDLFARQQRLLAEQKRSSRGEAQMDFRLKHGQRNLSYR